MIDSSSEEEDTEDEDGMWLLPGLVTIRLTN